jgi:haloacid dehalogenase-like hydrolase
MAEHMFLRTTIAVVWDFDSTLVPGCMQEPLFRHFGVEAEQFWKEADALPQFYRQRGVTRTSRDTLYLSHILAYVRAGRFAGLNNRMLRELGSKLDFYPGLPDFFPKTKDRIAKNSKFAKHEIAVEHYIVSAGLREMIMGSSIAPHVDDVWACEFAEASAEPGYLQEPHSLFDEKAGVVCEIAYAVDDTSKTRAMFEINKGCNKLSEIDVNATVAQDIRRVPFQNMVYIADGSSDVPCFTLVGGSGGRTYAVYEAGSGKEFQKAYDLQKQQRVEAFGAADYSDGSHTAMWIIKAVEDIAERIVREQGADARG